MKKSKSSAIVAGSFDPVTKGHMYLIDYAAGHYEKVWVVIFVNDQKDCMFSMEQRLEMLKAACAGYENVIVDANEGMQYLYAKEKGITRAIRGYRSPADLSYEKEIAAFHQKVYPGYETELLPCPDGLKNVSSTVVRDFLEEQKDISSLVPAEILPLIGGFYAENFTS